MAKHYKIHPGIGFARVGNSDGDSEGENYFIGPEIPGVVPTPQNGKYRDTTGRIRRQAARFRVFEYDDAYPAAQPVEVRLGAHFSAIEWTVHLANKKANWYEFKDLDGEEVVRYPTGHDLRNGSISAPSELFTPQRKQKYVIDLGPRTLTVPGEKKEFRKSTAGSYPATSPGSLKNGLPGTFEIDYLGTALTDADSRLLVIGGLGRAGTTGAVPARLDYANNPNWFDDTSDGPVQATVVLSDGTRVPATSAWVIVGPPDYAPPIEHIVTMYDLLYDLAVREFGYNPSLYNVATKTFLGTYQPSFTREVYPILARSAAYGWVNEATNGHHNWNYTALATRPFPGGRLSPTAIFNLLRDPGDWRHNLRVDRKMPKLFGDTGRTTSALTLTRTQYHIMKLWKSGKFLADWHGPPTPASIITAEGLDRAALEAACGGAFDPGIEASWIMRDKRIYQSPFRFKEAITNELDFTGLTPGSVTARSALPWHSDFIHCNEFWWPAARPDQVFRDTPSGTVMRLWALGINEDPPNAGFDEVKMVQEWHRLGFVKANAGAGPAFKEVERDPTLPR